MSRPDLSLDVEGLSVVRSALLHLLVSGPWDASVGVCGNVHRHVRCATNLNGYEVCEYYAYEWPKARRMTEHEVSPWFIPDGEAHYLWEGNALGLRREFMQFMLQCVERDIAALAV